MTRKELKMYLAVAKTLAKFGTCGRAQVGAVLVKDRCIIGSGFNGSAKGDTHCGTNGHIMVGGHCQKAIHAEENAVINAARSASSTVGAVMVCTHEPCYRCVARLINAGVSCVYYEKSYGDHDPHKEELLRRVYNTFTLEPI